MSCFNVLPVPAWQEIPTDCNFGRSSAYASYASPKRTKREPCGENSWDARESPTKSVEARISLRRRTRPLQASANTSGGSVRENLGLLDGDNEDAFETFKRGLRRDLDPRVKAPAGQGRAA